MVIYTIGDLIVLFFTGVASGIATTILVALYLFGGMGGGKGGKRCR